MVTGPRTPNPGRDRSSRWPCWLVVAATLASAAPATAGPEPSKLVVVFYPHEGDGAPGIVLVNRGIRAVLDDSDVGRIDVRNEYVDTTRLGDADFMRAQRALLQQKYAGRKVDLIMAGLSAGLDFALAVRDDVFRGVPVVHVLVDEKEVAARRMPPDVIGVPVRMDLTGTLDLALRLHPDTRRVFVIAGSAAFDTKWAAEARRAFGPYEGRVEFEYLTGLPMADLLTQVGDLPAGSLIYYLHILKDRAGGDFIPAEALQRLAERANAPIYTHVDTFVDRGAIGGHVYSHEAEGRAAARLGLRIVSSEAPTSISVPGAGENTYLFNAHQLRRWGVREADLPSGSEIRFRDRTFWDTYRWHVIAGIAVLVAQTALIVGLLIHRARRRRAEDALRSSQREAERLAGRLIEAQEAERRRIARELHDDLSQGLALLSVELDLLARRPPGSPAETARCLHDLSARVRELTSAVHDLSHELHPSKLEHLGLESSIRGLCNELGQRHGLTVAFAHHAVPAAIPEDIALCLYRITQEALHNVVKHGYTDRARVELAGNLDGLRLRINDDGVGFDPSAQDRGGLGLVSIRERLSLVGGTVFIDSRPGGGTRIDVRVPLSTSAEDVVGSAVPELVTANSNTEPMS